MFGIPMWLVNIILTLAKTIGIPLLQKAFPSFPGEVWEAIKSILSHVGGAPNPQSAQERAINVHTAIKGCTGVGCPIDTVK